MKAVRVWPGRGVEVVDVPRPAIQEPTDAILRITAAAICGSDIHAKNGHIPGIKPGSILGHEFVGVVEEVGPAVRRLRPGDRVTAPPAFWCGSCPECRRGEPHHCRYGGVYGEHVQGAQAEYLRLINADITASRIPDSVSDEEAVLVPDVFQTGFHAAYEARVSPGDTVVIYGVGPIGIGAVISSLIMGASRVYAVDLVPFRLQVAKEYGAVPIDAREEDPVEVVRRDTGVGADAAIEAAGSTAALSNAVRSVRRGGRVSVVGLFHEPFVLPMQDLSFYGITISAGLAHIGRVDQLMRLVEDGRVRLSRLITHRFPLERAPEAYEVAEKRKDEVLKVLLKP